MSRTRWVRLAGLATIPLVTSAAIAGAPRLGEAVPGDVLATIDYTVLPDGNGLPPGSGSAETGASVYRAHCASCHGADGTGGLNDRIVGGLGSLGTAAPIKTVGSYWPYATTLFDYIRRAMPYQAPGTLSDDQLYAVTAYVLSLDGIVGPRATLDARSLPKVEMPNRNGFVRAD